MTPSLCSECLEAHCICGAAYRYMAPDSSASVIWAVLLYRSPAERRDILKRALDDLSKCGSAPPDAGAASTDADKR